MNTRTVQLFSTILALLTVNGQDSDGILPTHVEFAIHVSDDALISHSYSNSLHTMSFFWYDVMYQCTRTPNEANSWFMCDSRDATTSKCQFHGSGMGLQIDNHATDDSHIDQIRIEQKDSATNEVMDGIYATLQNGGNWIGDYSDPVTEILASASRLYHFQQIEGESYWAIRDEMHEIEGDGIPTCFTFNPTVSPTQTPEPTPEPTNRPTPAPTPGPTAQPTVGPTTAHLPIEDIVCVSNGLGGYSNLNGEYIAVASGDYMFGSGPLNPLFSIDTCAEGNCNIYKMSLCNGNDYYFGVWAERWVITTSPPPGPEFDSINDEIDVIFGCHPTIDLDCHWTRDFGEWGEGFMSLTFTKGPCL